MEIIYSILYIYLGIGFLYAIYIWLFAGDTWVAIPSNILGGPIAIFVGIFRSLKTREITLKEFFRHRKAVIFDLDGTIIDSQPFRNQAMENVLESLDAAWIFPKYAPGLNEKTKWENILDAEPEFEPHLTTQELAEKTQQEYLKLYAEVEPIEGFWSFARFLKETRKYKLGLATNSNRDITMEILKRMGAEAVFDVIATADDVKRNKPFPDVYQKVLKELKVRPSQVVAFEDTIVGATSARKAGLDVIVIWDGEDEFPEDFPKGIQFFLENYSGLEEFIEKDGAEMLKEAAKNVEEENYLEDTKDSGNTENT